MTSTLNDLLTTIGVGPGQIAANSGGVHVAPVDMALPLLDYQEEALRHALRDTATQGYGYIALDMGLGKTPVGIAVTAAFHAVQESPFLVVVPPSLRINWQREYQKFAPWMTTHIITGTNVYDLPSADVYILGDSLVAAWSDKLSGFQAVGKDARGRPIYQQVAPAVVHGVVIDEAHRFKNKSNRSTALLRICKGVGRNVFPMSGTPTPNGKHVELANQIDAMGDKAWKDIGGKGLFWNHYAPTIDKYGTRQNKDGEALFRSMSSAWYFRRLRDDVLDLPNKGRSTLALEGRGGAVRKYKEAEQNLIAFLRGEGKDTAGAQRAEALVKLTTLRKLAGQAKVKAAIEHITELLNEEPGGVFVVAEHRDVMDDLMFGLMKFRPTTVQGGMSDAEKQQNIDDFCSGKSRVLIGQIVAAGVGLTLHGGGINHRVVVVQLPWTPADLKQAEDRLHRIGQTRDVQVEVALAAIDGSWTIDERLWNLLESKNFLSTQITDGEGQFLLGEVIDGLLDTYR